VINVHEALALLNSYLRKTGETRTFVICGGASLILRGIEGRGTADVDVIGPAIDKSLRDAALKVAHELDLHTDWLNDKPLRFFAKDLPVGWAERTVNLYQKSHLCVQSVSDFDLAVLKFLAECDRAKDFQDLVDLNLSEKEIVKVVQHALTRNPGDAKNWHEIVARVEQRLRRKLGYETN
jgi:hypothetical protein